MIIPYATSIPACGENLLGSVLELGSRGEASLIEESAPHRDLAQIAEIRTVTTVGRSIL